MIPNFKNVYAGVYESSPYGDREVSVFSRLMKERIIFLGTVIKEEVANVVVAQLLHMNHEDPDKEIQMYINSPGGHIYHGLAIYDTMQMVSNPISTVAVGMTASFGTILLLAEGMDPSPSTYEVALQQMGLSYREFNTAADFSAALSGATSCTRKMVAPRQKASRLAAREPCSRLTQSPRIKKPY